MHDHQKLHPKRKAERGAGFQLETERRVDGEWVRWSDIRELLESLPNVPDEPRGT